MAVTSDPFTNVDLASFIGEVWTPIVNEALFDNVVLSGFVTDLSPFAASGGDIFHVPDIFTNKLGNSGASRAQTTQGAEITTDAPAASEATLTINQHKYVAFIIGDADMKAVMSQYGFVLSEAYAREAANILIEELEQAIAALWSSISTNTIGDTATVVSDAEIRQAIEKLASSKYNLDECAFFVHPYVYWNQLHAVAKYYQQYSVGPSDTAGPTATGNLSMGGKGLKKAFRGVLYGIPVYTTANIVSGLQTYRNLLLHKSAFGFAVRTPGGNMARVQAKYELRNLGMLTVVDMIYGVAVLREPGAVLVNASSAFVGS